MRKLRNCSLDILNIFSEFLFYIKSHFLRRLLNISPNYNETDNSKIRIYKDNGSRYRNEMLISQTLLKTKQTKKREKRRYRKYCWNEREKLEASRGERKVLDPFLSPRSKDGRTGAKRNACQREKEPRREEWDRRVGQLREMDLGAPRGHILFPFEAPDKSNAAECIIR